MARGGRVRCRRPVVPRCRSRQRERVPRRIGVPALPPVRVDGAERIDGSLPWPRIPGACGAPRRFVTDGARGLRVRGFLEATVLVARLVQRIQHVLAPVVDHAAALELVVVLDLALADSARPIFIFIRGMLTLVLLDVQYLQRDLAVAVVDLHHADAYVILSVNLQRFQGLALLLYERRQSFFGALLVRGDLPRGELLAILFLVAFLAAPEASAAPFSAAAALSAAVALFSFPFSFGFASRLAQPIQLLLQLGLLVLHLLLVRRPLLGRVVLVVVLLPLGLPWSDAGNVHGVRVLRHGIVPLLVGKFDQHAGEHEVSFLFGSRRAMPHPDLIVGRRGDHLEQNRQFPLLRHRAAVGALGVHVVEPFPPGDRAG